MKLLLTILLLCSYTGYADKIYHLECSLDKYKVSLLLYDDSTFELAGIDCIENECDVIMLACGRYKSTNEGIELIDKLWHNRMQLKNAYGAWLITSDNFGLFNKAFFPYDDIRNPSFYDNSFKVRTKAKIRLQKAAKDSVLNSDPIATLCFEQGKYKFGNYTIKFYKGGYYSFRLGKHLISIGKRTRNGNYLILKDDISHERFMLKVNKENMLEVIYLPLLPDGGTFKLLEAKDHSR